MLILSLDTTTPGGSYALVREQCVLGEEAGDVSSEQAARLPGDLARLLARESIALEEVSLLAVATGPGSFTGLRVGIATMQGLAMAIGAPLIGVSALDALAVVGQTEDVQPGTRVATWMNAWRGDVFAALYQGERELEAPIVARPETLLTGLGGSPVLFTGDGALTHREVIRAALGTQASFSDPAQPLLAGAIARLAGIAYLSGQRPPPHAIEPLYVRRRGADVAGPIRPV
jgi:tRNA threonylcarbamoyladenosine biosynthesis protein TsaB